MATRLNGDCLWGGFTACPRPQPPVRFGLFFAMDGQHPFEDVELNAESRAKRLFVSIEPLPDKRIYRIDERGVETYEEYVSTFLP